MLVPLDKIPHALGAQCRVLAPREPAATYATQHTGRPHEGNDFVGVIRQKIELVSIRKEEYALFGVCDFGQFKNGSG